MNNVRAKKYFGQHFLKDESIAKKITDSLNPGGRYRQVLEIGPGMGVLSQFLFARKDIETKLIEIDRESVQFLRQKYPEQIPNIAEGDFLQMDLEKSFGEPFAIIGNFPYNISTQILFSVLDNRKLIPEVVGMFQKEVGERIASPPGNRDYGIPSVLMQAWYNVELLFTLSENDFSPPPKVKSCVLRFERKENFMLECDEKKFFNIVKTSFNQRRKMLSNALSSLVPKEKIPELPYMTKRAEQLSWQQFVELTNLIEQVKDNDRK
jgi:16S rRNA (adenine1518-N6/adenine1519-N6)-dimethyltransferase